MQLLLSLAVLVLLKCSGANPYGYSLDVESSCTGRNDVWTKLNRNYGDPIRDWLESFRPLDDDADQDENNANNKMLVQFSKFQTVASVASLETGLTWYVESEIYFEMYNIRDIV